MASVVRPKPRAMVKTSAIRKDLGVMTVITTMVEDYRRGFFHKCEIKGSW